MVSIIIQAQQGKPRRKICFTEIVTDLKQPNDEAFWLCALTVLLLD